MLGRRLRYSQKTNHSATTAGVHSLKTVFLILALLLGGAEPQYTIGSGFSTSEVEACVIPQGPHWLCERLEDEPGDQPALLSAVALNDLIPPRSAARCVVSPQAERPGVDAHPIRAPPRHPLQTFT